MSDMAYEVFRATSAASYGGQAAPRGSAHEAAHRAGIAAAEAAIRAEERAKVVEEIAAWLRAEQGWRVGWYPREVANAFLAEFGAPDTSSARSSPSCEGLDACLAEFGVIPDFTGCYVGEEGDEQARLYDCRRWPNGNRARRDYALENDGERIGDYAVRVVYARWLTRQEKWEDYGSVNWEPEDWDETGPEPEPPDEPPEDWEPNEEDPSWTTCKRTDLNAARCWRVELKISAIDMLHLRL